MQKGNSVIKNYILSPKTYVLGKTNSRKKSVNKDINKEYLAYNIINEIRISFSKH